MSTPTSRTGCSPVSTPHEARRHVGPPPGYLTRQQVAAALGVSSARLGQIGILDELDSWALPGSRVRLFPKGQVVELVVWRRTRQGLIALGLQSPTAPAWPESLLQARLFNGEDYYGVECPVCGGSAMADPMRPELGTWCPEHGVMPGVAGDDEPRD